MELTTNYEVEILSEIIGILSLLCNYSVLYPAIILDLASKGSTHEVALPNKVFFKRSILMK